MDMSMTMSMAMPTSTGAAPAATTSAMSMGGMDMGGGGKCKISMLWNWYTVDACFISSQWRVTSQGYFAGTCIGVIALTMSLFLLRYLHQRFDRFIVDGVLVSGINRRPTIFQQIARALLHTMQFAVAYFVMLMAMYYNGYIIISILIGAFLGYFIFEWQKIDAVAKAKEDAASSTGCCG